MAFVIEKLSLPELLHVTSDVYPDGRGFFVEMFRENIFSDYGVRGPWVQFNRSYSKQNVIRGMHYQRLPKAQGKLVMPMQGEIFDVAVDMRQNKPTFGLWAGIKLEAKKAEMLYIPPGFAHGFCTLSQEAEVLYLCSDYYVPEQEGGVVWNDSKIGIEWPIENPIVSARDAALPTLEKADNNFV
jgi:dTDP-4-dehydrorhamnose 3,5-epimerase